MPAPLAHEACRSRDLLTLAAVGTAALAVSALTTALSVVPVSELGIYFDGHRALEVARSFPLPFPPEALRYAGDAPGYPALIWIARGVLPDAWFNWGEVALVVAWLAFAAAAATFAWTCRSLGMAPLVPGLLFVVGNARWISIGSSAHPEVPAMALAIAALAAYLNDRLGLGFALLAAAVLCRFQAILLVLPMAIDLIVVRRRRDWRTFAWIAVPGVALGLWHVYMMVRIPGFTTVWEAHQVLWSTSFVVPFSELLMPKVAARSWPITFALVTVYLSTVVLGLRKSERHLWVLPLWVGVIVLFHVSLGTKLAVHAFPRLSILAWPAALLIGLRWLGPLSRTKAVLLCASLALVGITIASSTINSAKRFQLEQPWIPDARSRLDDDEPHWYRLGS